MHLSNRKIKKDKGSQSNYAEDKVGYDEKDVFVFSVFKINKSTSCLLMELSNRISVEREFMAERAIFWGTSWIGEKDGTECKNGQVCLSIEHW